MEKKFCTRSVYTSSAAALWSSQIDVPFKVGRIVVHPIIYNYLDAGVSYPGTEKINAYRQYCVMSNIMGETQIMGIVMETAYSTGANPLAGYSYQFKEPTEIHGLYDFYVTDLNMKTRIALIDQKMLISIEFYEA